MGRPYRQDAYTDPARRYTEEYVNLIRCTDQVEREQIRDRLENLYTLMLHDPATKTICRTKEAMKGL